MCRHWLQYASPMCGGNGMPAAMDSNTITGSYFHALADNVIEATDFRNQNFAASHKVEVKK